MKRLSLLHWALGLLPIIDGVDKFFNKIAYWPQYLAPQLAELAPLSMKQIMYVLGVKEILIGLIVLKWPRLGGYLLALLMAGICVSLLLLRDHYNIILLDIVIGIAAIHLATASRRSV